MNLNDLTPDTMKSLLNYLVESGAISEDMIKKAMKGAVPTEMKRMTDMIHQLLCKQNHHPDISIYACHYYEEEILKTGWEEKEHEYWLNITSEVMEELQLTNEEQLRKELTKAKTMNTKLHEFQVSEPKAYQLLMKINEWE